MAFIVAIDVVLHVGLSLFAFASCEALAVVGTVVVPPFLDTRWGKCSMLCHVYLVRVASTESVAATQENGWATGGWRQRELGDGERMAGFVRAHPLSYFNLAGIFF